MRSFSSAATGGDRAGRDVGIAVGVLAGLGAGLFGVYLYRRNKKNSLTRADGRSAADVDYGTIERNE